MAGQRTYLGDGLYAEVIDGQIVLTAEGCQKTNAIYLDREAYDALVCFREKLRLLEAEEAAMKGAEQ